MLVQVPLGIATAASVRVGNELGAGQPLRAKKAAYVSVALGGENIPCLSTYWQGVNIN